MVKEKKEIQWLQEVSLLSNESFLFSFHYITFHIMLYEVDRTWT